MPDIPPSWSQALAAVGAILVVVLILRWSGKAMTDQTAQSATLIDRAFDIADRIVTAGVTRTLHEPPAADVAVTIADATRLDTSATVDVHPHDDAVR